MNEERESGQPLTLESIVDESLKKYRELSEGENENPTALDLRAAELTLKEKVDSGIKPAELLEVFVEQTSILPSQLSDQILLGITESWNEVLVELSTIILAEEMCHKDPSIANPD